MRIIEVAPLDGGWRVSVDGVAGDMVFTRGGAAETAARKLAARLGRHGAASELRIRLRDGSMAGRFIWPAEPPAPAAASSRPSIAA